MNAFHRAWIVGIVVCCACQEPAGSVSEPSPSTVGATPPSATSADSPAPPREAPPALCTASPGRLCPVDEGPADASFAAFRQAMLEAVKANDERRLLELVDPAIRTSFGDGGGVADLRAAWKITTAESPLWAELEEILTTGGSFRGQGEERSFWAPYIYANWPESVDAFEHVAAIRPAVEIRSGPAANAEVVTIVDWAILRIVREGPQNRNEGWHHVRTSGGKTGWVRAVDVRSPIDYRAGFSKRSGQWKMEALVAGD